MKADDSSLTAEQYQTVHLAARALLDRGSAWGKFPTPVGTLLEAANLKVAPISAFDERSMLQYLLQAGRQRAESLLRRAIEKVRGIFDVQENVVHIDPEAHPAKQTFIKLHEAGHSEIPHQKGLYRWIQDCDKHIDPQIAALFEREANTFASLVLFQDEGFANEVVGEPFGIKIPMDASKRYGSSLYAAFREYVRRHHKDCAVIVLEKPTLCPLRGRVAVIRRMELSPSFKTKFLLDLPAELDDRHDLMRFAPVEPRRMSKANTFRLVDRNGDVREFIGEGLRTGYYTVLLIHGVSTLASPKPFGLIRP